MFFGFFGFRVVFFCVFLGFSCYLLGFLFFFGFLVIFWFHCFFFLLFLLVFVGCYNRIYILDLWGFFKYCHMLIRPMLLNM